MGACSTKTVNRHEAYNLLLQALSKASGQELEHILNYVCGGERPLIQMDDYHLADFKVE